MQRHRGHDVGRRVGRFAQPLQRRRLVLEVAELLKAALQVGQRVVDQHAVRDAEVGGAHQLSHEPGVVDQRVEERR